MRVLLTGATGAIGLSLIEELSARFCDILVLASPGSHRNRLLATLAAPGIRWQECGLADYSSFSTNDRFDAMIHMAWSGGTDRWNIDLNLHSARQCVEAVRLAARLGCTTFIGTGSQAECGMQTSPLTAEMPCRPNTPFGAAKNVARDLARIEAAQMPGMRFLWARILSVYGPRDRESALVTAAVRQLIRGELPMFTSGTQIWDFLYADDAARAIADMLNGGIDGQTYVVGSGSPRPLREYLEKLLNFFGVSPDLCIGKLSAEAYTPNYLAADITLLQKHLDWYPRVEFDEGIKRTIAYCKANPA